MPRESTQHIQKYTYASSVKDPYKWMESHKAHTYKILKQYFRKQRYGGSAAKEKAPNFGAFCYAAGYVGQLRSA